MPGDEQLEANEVENEELPVDDGGDVEDSYEGSDDEEIPGEGGEDEAVEQAVKATGLSEAQVREIMGESINGLYERVSGELGQLRDMFVKSQRYAQPQQHRPQPQNQQGFQLPADPRELENWTVYDWHKAFSSLNDHHTRNNQSLLRQLQANQRQASTKEQAKQIADYLEGEIREVASTLPWFKKHDGSMDEDAFEDLADKLANKINRSNWQNARSIIAKEAKAMSDRHMKKLERRYKRKMKGVKQNREAPPKAGGGGGTKPTEQQPEDLAGSKTGFRKHLARIRKGKAQ